MLDATSDDKDLPRFVTKKGLKFIINLGRDYQVNKEIRIKRPTLRSNLYDFSDTYIVVKGNIIVTKQNNAKRNRAVVFKNNTLFISCICKLMA